MIKSGFLWTRKGAHFLLAVRVLFIDFQELDRASTLHLVQAN